MTRMIERWFPCAEVSEASAAGWGTGRSEKGLFTWFAARPLAQAKAAVLTSLLPWPEDADEQRELQQLVRRALSGRLVGATELSAIIHRYLGDDAAILDPFSGRGMIPLEAAKLGVQAFGLDYSPVATLASSLLADYPLRDWSGEPELQFGRPIAIGRRLDSDVSRTLVEVGERYAAAMEPYYPTRDGSAPWGYVWAVTLPCQECGRRFPLTGSLMLRYPLAKKNDPGQSYDIEVNEDDGTFSAVVHDGRPRGLPSLRSGGGSTRAGGGKVAVCYFCGHVHSKTAHSRLAREGLGRDELLVAAHLDNRVGKFFCEPTVDERRVLQEATDALALEPDFPVGLPAVPHESIPTGNTDTVRPSAYGAKTYGDLCNDRQTLGFVRLARIIGEIGSELMEAGISPEYSAALVGYAGSVLARRIKCSTRGTALRAHNHPTSNRVQTNHIFGNEASVGFSYDYFETGLSAGPGSWASLSKDTLAALRNISGTAQTRPARFVRGSAAALPYAAERFVAVVTDPPYDNMIDYSDASDLFYVWLKRALSTTDLGFQMTAHESGVQEKSAEAIVKRGGSASSDHRTRDHYDSMMTKAFTEARRVVGSNALVTIVFGHGDPEVLGRFLAAVSKAGLVLTGAWPAKTEAGGGGGAANIVTTLTMPCRPAALNRPVGRRSAVEAAVKQEVRSRIALWSESGLAPTDMLMASAGPAMEVVGRFSEIVDVRGEPVESTAFLPVARQAVQEAEAIEIDHHPLETFDARTRFALWWVRLFARRVAPKSELPWQALASSLDLTEVRDLVPNAKKGCSFVEAQKFMRQIGPESSVIDVALEMAKKWADGLDAVGEVLVDAGRDAEDAYLWAAISFLADRLPESDPDAIAWTGILRNRRNVGSAARGVVTRTANAANEERQRRAQGTLFDVDELDEDEVQV